MMITPLKKYGEKPAKKPEDCCEKCSCCEKPEPAEEKLNVVYLCISDDDYEPEVFDNEEAARWYVVENAYGYDDDLVCDDVDEMQSRLYQFFEDRDWDTYDFHVWYESREVRS